MYRGEKGMNNTKTLSSLIALLTLVFVLVGCGKEGTSTRSNESTGTPTTNNPTSNPEEPTQEPPTLEKLIRVFVPNFLDGTLRIEQDNLQFDFTQSFSFSSSAPNQDRYIDVVIPNKLFEYDVWVEDSTYDNTSTSSTHDFTGSYKIRSIIPDSYTENQISVTVFTHLAKIAYDFYNGGVTWENLDNAYQSYLDIDSFLSLVPKHVGIPASNTIADDVKYGLWISALSRLAEVHEDVFEISSNLTLKTLLVSLKNDLEHNGIFSGNAQHSNINLDHQTMRLHLCQALYQFLGTSHNQTPYDQADVFDLNMTNTVAFEQNQFLFATYYNDLTAFENTIPTISVNSFPPWAPILPSGVTLDLNLEAFDDSDIISFKAYLEFSGGTVINIHSSNITNTTISEIEPLGPYYSEAMQFYGAIIDKSLNKYSFASIYALIFP